MPGKRSRGRSWRRQEEHLDHDPHLTHGKEREGSRVGQEEVLTAVQLQEHLGLAESLNQSL